MEDRWRHVCSEPGVEHTHEWADSQFLQGAARAQVILLVILMTAALIKMIREAVSIANDDSRRSAWWRWLRSCVDVFSCKSFAVLSQEELRVREEANAKLIAFWRITFQAMAVLLTPLMFFLFLDSGLFVASFLGNPNLEAVGFITWHPGFFVTCTFCLTASLFFVLLPSWLTKRSIYLFIVLGHLRCGASFLAPSGLAQFMFYEVGFTLLQLLAYVYCTDVPFVMAMNACTCAAVGWALQQKLLSGGYENGCETNVLNQSLAKFAIISVAYFVHRHLMLSQIRCTIEARSSRKVESSVETLLSGMCDAVVHLRPDMTLKQTSSKLSAMLLHTLPIARDVSFLDYVHGDLDKTRMRKELSQSGGSELPGTLHLSLRDAWMCPVPVQLFHTACLDAVNEEFYIVGVLEAGDAARNPRPPRQHGDKQPGSPKEHSTDSFAEQSRVVQKLPSQESISEWESVVASLSANALPVMEPGQCRQGEIAVWVNTTKKGMPMVKCTSEFFASFGGSAVEEGTWFVSWARQVQQEALTVHVQQSINELMTNQIPMKDMKLCMSPPHMTNIEIQATLRFSLPASSEGNPGPLPPMKITVRNLRYKGKRSMLTPQNTGQLARQPSRASPARAGAHITPPVMLNL